LTTEVEAEVLPTTKDEGWDLLTEADAGVLTATKVESDVLTTGGEVF
jgi:hypothetical protein